MLLILLAMIVCAIMGCFHKGNDVGEQLCIVVVLIIVAIGCIGAMQ